MITNGYFAQDERIIDETAQVLCASGVNDVLLSVDVFHQEFIPIEPVMHFAESLLKHCVPSLRVQPAGSALLAECNALKSPEPVALGCYRGFSMELSFDLVNKEYTLTMRGHMSYSVTLGSDLHGNITRIDNALESMEGRKKNCEQGLENTTAQLT